MLEQHLTACARCGQEVEYLRLLDGLLADLAPGPLLPLPEPDCPDTNTLAAHAEGRLPDPERARVAGHFAACRPCRYGSESIDGWIRQARAAWRPAPPRLLEAALALEPAVTRRSHADDLLGWFRRRLVLLPAPAAWLPAAVPACAALVLVLLLSGPGPGEPPGDGGPAVASAAWVGDLPGIRHVAVRLSCPPTAADPAPAVAAGAC